MIPVVLHHGLFGFGQMSAGPVRLTYFRGIDHAIAAMGHPLIVSRVHPTAAVATRARQLKETILRQLEIMGRPREKVLLVAHSMGGLDARYMITKLGMDSHVAALLTVTTPHRGSPLADWCVRNLGNRLGGYRIMNLLGVDVQAAHDLCTETCAKFNEQVPDMPGVRYFSVSAARPWNKMPAFAIPSHRIIYQAEGDNDSIVSVKSSTYATHLGTWPADHFHTINKRFTLDLKDPTGDIAPYWANAVKEVVQRAGLQDQLS